MDHRDVMLKNLTPKSEINDDITPRVYLKASISSCHDLCKHGNKHDSVLSKWKERVPKHLATSKIPEEDYSPKRLASVEVCKKGERCRLKTAFQTEEGASCYSGVNNVAHLQHSDASSELIDCMSEESVNMKSRALSPLLKSIITSKHHNSFLKDGSLRESAAMVPEAATSTSDEIASINNGMPWAWSDGSSDESVVMDLEFYSSAPESMTCNHNSHGSDQKGSSVEFEFTPQKIISPASSNEAKESSHKSRTLKQETAGTLWKSMKPSMAGSLKEQKQVNRLKLDEKRMREIPMLRSSLPVRTSLLGKIKAKERVDVGVEDDITNEKSPCFDGTVKQAGVIKGPGTPMSPIIIKKKMLSPGKRIDLSQKPAVLPKTKSLLVKYRSQMIVSGGIKGLSSKTDSKLGEEKVLRQLGAASQAPKSTTYCGPRLNYRNLRSVKTEVEAGKVDEIKEKTHAVERKLKGVALKALEKRNLDPRSQKLSTTMSSRSSISTSALSSVLTSSTSKEENNCSQLTISNGGESKKTRIDKGKGRTSLSDYKRIQKMTTNISLEDKSFSSGKLPSKNFPSRSLLSCSALLSSSSKEESDAYKLIVSDEKTQIVMGKGKTLSHDYTRIQRRSTSVSLEDNSLSPKKMSFGRGKEAYLKENTGKKQLRFLHEKSATEVEKFEGEIQEKNTQALFNDVIEKTVNNLVEVRKSKVKALVGAFESIISLQERTVQ